MKKLVSLVLGLALVLGFSAAAEAVALDLGPVGVEITGQLHLYPFQFWSGGGLDFLILEEEETWVQLKLGGEAGGFSFWITPTIDAGEDLYLGGGVMYQVSEAFSLGVVHYGAFWTDGQFFVSPLTDDHWGVGDQTCLKAEVDLGCFQADLNAGGYYNNSDDWWFKSFGVLNWAAGDFSFYMPYGYRYEYDGVGDYYWEFEATPGVKYALNDRWYLGAEYDYYHSFSTWISPYTGQDAGLGAGYQAGPFDAYGYVYHCLSYCGTQWELGLGWTFNDYVKVKLEYYGDDSSHYDIWATLELTLK